MKRLLPFILGLCCQGLYAQITLTESDNAPSDGTRYDYIVSYGDDIEEEINLVTLDYDGANVSWDLSALVGDSLPISFEDAASGNDSEFFSSSLVNIFENNMIGTEKYITQENGYYFYNGLSAYMPGSNTPFVRTTFENSKLFMSYPLTYLDSSFDEFSGTIQIINGGQNTDFSGETSLIVDSYGTLILPYGSIENVLRVRAISTSIDTFMGALVASHSDAQYFWYHEDYNLFIASYEEFYTDAVLEDRVASYISEEDFSLVVENQSKPNLKVYPNPAQDVINLEFPSSESYEFRIIDAQGKIIVEGNSENQVENNLTLSGLKSGMYLIQFTNESHSLVSKFMVE